MLWIKFVIHHGGLQDLNYERITEHFVTSEPSFYLNIIASQLEQMTKFERTPKPLYILLFHHLLKQYVTLR